MKRICSMVLAFCMCFSTVFAYDTSLEENIKITAKYLEETVENPVVNATGGEWTVIGLARSDYDIDQGYFDDYYKTVEKYVKDCDGILHEKKYTEYSRVTLALTAIGADPTDVSGYNLLEPLGDFDKTIWQGINGPIWALIALDCKNYEMPINKDANTQATRQMYVDYILENQNTDGGWSLTNAKISDTDITGMALVALENYISQEKVYNACQTALDYLSNMQNENGGFDGAYGENSEPTVQAIVALCALNISLDDARFVKNGNTLLDNLLSFYIKNEGFAHDSLNKKTNLMATEQALYALVALDRSLDGKTDLYDMSDVSPLKTDDKTGLSGKHADVLKMPIVTSVSFPDTKDRAVLELSSRLIINGNTDGNFYPDNTMTRAEFATIIVKALGLSPKSVEKFNDVSANDWFSPFVGTAVTYGIVTGTSDVTFNPNGKITNEEAAVMVFRAAKLCGLNKTYDDTTTRNILSQFIDYMTISSWAKESLAFCYDTDILDQSAISINPKQNITRIEVANMIYNLLENASLT